MSLPGYRYGYGSHATDPGQQDGRGEYACPSCGEMASGRDFDGSALCSVCSVLEAKS